MRLTAKTTKTKKASNKLRLKYFQSFDMAVVVVKMKERSVALRVTFGVQFFLFL